MIPGQVSPHTHFVTLWEWLVILVTAELKEMLFFLSTMLKLNSFLVKLMNVFQSKDQVLVFQKKNKLIV